MLLDSTNPMIAVFFFAWRTRLAPLSGVRWAALRNCVMRFFWGGPRVSRSALRPARPSRGGVFLFFRAKRILSDRANSVD